MERLRLLFVILTTTLFITSANAQKNRFWDEDDINPQRAGFSNSQSNGCTTDQIIEMAYAGLTKPEINEKCGVSHEGPKEGGVIIPERFVRVGDIIDLLGDGRVLIKITKIHYANNSYAHAKRGGNKGNRMNISFSRVNRPDFWDRFNIGDSITFDFARRKYRLDVIDIFIDDGVAKITVQDAGPYKPR